MLAPPHAAAGLQWSREEVEAKLTDIMNTIYSTAKVIILGSLQSLFCFSSLCLQRCIMNTIYRTAKVSWCTLQASIVVYWRDEEAAMNTIYRTAKVSWKVVAGTGRL